jgi:hypothetical protein
MLLYLIMTYASDMLPAPGPYTQVCALDDSKPKELFCPMPVILVRAVTVDKVRGGPVWRGVRREGPCLAARGQCGAW